MKHTYCNLTTPVKEEDLPDMFGKRYKPILEQMLNLDKNLLLDFSSLINDIPQEHHTKLNNCEEFFLDKKACYLYFVEETDDRVSTDLGVCITLKSLDKEYYFFLKNIALIDHFSKITPIAMFNINNGCGGEYEYNFYIMKSKENYKLLMLKKIVKNATNNPKLANQKIVAEIDINDILSQISLGV